MGDNTSCYVHNHIVRKLYLQWKGLYNCSSNRIFF